MSKIQNQGMMITQITVENKTASVPILDPNLKHQMLKELEPQILERIKKGFDLYKGSVTLSQFIVIMCDVLFQQTHWQKFSKEILTFVELFLLIDLNHLQKIRFQQFTNYLIDRQQNQTAKQECQFLPAQKLNQMQLQAQRIFKLQGCNNLGVLTNNKKNVQILQKKQYKRIDHLTCGGPLVNCLIFIAKYNVYCLTSNDKHISFYENADHTLVRRFLVPDNLYFMMIFGEDSPHYRLICASTIGHIYEFSISKILSVMNKKNKDMLKEQQRKIRQYPPDKQYKYFMATEKVVAEQKDISCIDVMSALDLFVTGSNDSKVRLYEMRESGLQFSKELDGHYKGVKGVSVSVHHKIIVSCSFDFDILVWNAYLQHPVARLQGHEAPLISVECPKKYQIIISMDAKSIMKIWSSENYQLVQNIVIYQNFPANTSINFTFKNQTNLVMVWTKKIKFYQYVVSYNPKLTDDADITAVKYSNKNLEVYIGSRRSLKVWSIISGTMTKNYKNIVKTDISIIELDDRQRKCFIGTIQGQIISIDLFSGLLISTYSAHQQQISVLMYNNLNKLLISGGWDRRVKIHNDTHHLERIESRENVLRNINNISEKDISGGYFSPSQLVIATFSKSNVCKLWDFQKGFLQTQFIVPSEISNALFVDPLPLLIIVDVKGTIYLFSTKYFIKNPYKLLTQWKNMYSIQKSSQISFISSSYTQPKGNQPLKCQLILGDQFGYIRIIDLTAFIEQQELKPITPEMIGNKNPYRIQDYNYAGMTQNSSNTHDFSQYQTNNIVPPANIKQILQIKAHNDRVNYVAVINQSTQSLILTAGSDSLVKIWNQEGEPRGVMRQGLSQNKNWQYQTNKKWCSRQITEYNKVKPHISNTFEDYLFRKRKETVPFTEDLQFQEINNDTIYKDLKEVERYLEKGTKKSAHRLY